MFSTTTRGNSRARNQRNAPYILDDLFVSFHRSAAGLAWRWRTELTILTTLTAALWRLALVITLIWAAVVLAAFTGLVVAVPHSRRFITRRFWCVLARHRFQRLCWEARLHTRAGRLPLVVRSKPTKTGVRLHVICRAGICAKDSEDNTDQLAAACYARSVRVAHHPRWSQLVTIDIIRHDLLAPTRIIPADIARDHEATPTRSAIPA